MGPAQKKEPRLSPGPDVRASVGSLARRFRSFLRRVRTGSGCSGLWFAAVKPAHGVGANRPRDDFVRRDFLTFARTLVGRADQAAFGQNVRTLLDAILGTVAAGQNRIASLRVAALSSGNHILTASFAAANTLAPAVSPVLTDLWPAAGSGFNLAVDSNALNIGRSGKGTLGISIESLGGFAETVQLSCAAGLPPGYICEFSPDAVKGNGPSAFTIRDSASVADPWARPLGFFSFAMLAFSLLFLGASNRRAYMIDACILVCAISLLGACAASPSSAVKPQTFVVTIRAMSGSGSGMIVHDAQVCVTVGSAE